MLIIGEAKAKPLFLDLWVVSRNDWGEGELELDDQGSDSDLGGGKGGVGGRALGRGCGTVTAGVF